MKKIFIMMMVLFTTITFAQNNNNGNNNNGNNNASDKENFFSIIKPYVEKLAKNVEEGVEFVKEEAPIIIEQYLIFTAVEYWIYIAIGFIVIGIGMGLFWYLGWLYNKHNGEEGIRWIPFVLGQIIGWSIIFSYLFDAIKVTWFPKLFLVEKFINLL